MNNYDFSKTYELNKDEQKHVESLPLYPYFTCFNKDKTINRICRIKKTGKSIDNNKYLIISSYIKIVKRYIDIETQKVKLDVELYNGNEIVTKTFDRSILSKNGLEALIQYGVCYNFDRPKDLLHYLLVSEQHADTIESYTQLGWIDINGTKAFKSNRLIAQGDSKKEAKYLGNIDIEPKGDRDKWFDMIKSEVIGNIPLTTVMLAGFASPILGYLNQKYDLGSILFNLSNSSSKGKTTAAMLATSVFGNPAIDKSTMITFNATSNALVSFASKCNSHTIALDEAIISTASDVTKQLYTLCAGRDKLRLNTDSELKEVSSFSSFIISTAEFDLIPDSATNGIRARVFELNDIFTTSAENSVIIKAIVTENYGFAGNEFVDFLIREKIDYIEKDYLKCQDTLLKQYFKSNPFKEKGELTERVFSKLAIILQTAYYFEQCFDIKISGKIINYLLKVEKDIDKVADRTKFLLDCILQFIAVNENRFISENNSYDFTPSAPFGRIIRNNSKTKIIVLKSKADEVFVNNKILDSKNLLNSLKEKGILECEKDRLYKRQKLSKKSEKQSCYIFEFESF